MLWCWQKQVQVLVKLFCSFCPQQNFYIICYYCYYDSYYKNYLFFYFDLLCILNILKYITILNLKEIMAPHTTYSLLRGQKPAPVQRLGTGSGNQRFGQGHRLEMNSISLFFDGGGNPRTHSESGQTPHRKALNWGPSCCEATVLTTNT